MIKYCAVELFIFPDVIMYIMYDLIYKIFSLDFDNS